MNSYLRDKTSKYKDEIKSNFKSYNDNTKKVSNQKILIHIKVVNSNKKNKFKNDSIKSLILIQEETNEKILPEDCLRIYIIVRK